MLLHLDGNFDIPDEGVNSDVEWLDDEDFEEPDLISFYLTRRKRI